MTLGLQSRPPAWHRFPAVRPGLPAGTGPTWSARAAASLAALQPELVILGTGARQRFVHPKLTRVLLEQGIGAECMDNPAACRTYNVLVGEGRKVIVALLAASA